MEYTTPLAAAASVFDLYDGYIRAVDAHYEKQKTGDILGSMLSGRGRYSGCPLHEPFLAELAQHVQALSKKGLSPDEAEALLQFMLVTEHVGRDHPARLPLETAEGQALPLLSFLRPESLQGLLTQYRRKLRKQPGLPCQREILKAMKAMAG